MHIFIKIIYLKFDEKCSRLEYFYYNNSIHNNDMNEIKTMTIICILSQ